MKRLLAGVVFGAGILVFILILLTLVPLRMHTPDLETSAIQSVRAIFMAMEMGKTVSGKGYPRSMADLQTILDPKLASGQQEGYRFTVSGDGKTFTITAVPVRYGGNTRRSFYADQTGDLRVSSGPAFATASSPELVQLSR